jgi:hypothetical protein
MPSTVMSDSARTCRRDERWYSEGAWARCEIWQGRGGELIVLDGTFFNGMDLSIAGSMEENLDITTLQPILTTRGWVEACRSAAPGSHETRCSCA